LHSTVNQFGNALTIIILSIILFPPQPSLSSGGGRGPSLNSPSEQGEREKKEPLSPLFKKEDMGDISPALNRKHLLLSEREETEGTLPLRKQKILSRL